MGLLVLIRDSVRARDKQTCQKCFKIWDGKNRKFDVHHLDLSMESKSDIEYDLNNMDKLITMCHKCHLNLPHLIDKRKEWLKNNPHFFDKQRAKQKRDARKRRIALNKDSKEFDIFMRVWIAEKIKQDWKLKEIFNELGITKIKFNKIIKTYFS